MRNFTHILYSITLLRHWHNWYRHLYDWDSDKLCCQLSCLWNLQSLLKNFNISTVEDCSKTQGSNLTPCLWGILVLTVYLQLILSFNGKVIYGVFPGRGWILIADWTKRNWCKWILKIRFIGSAIVCIYKEETAPFSC